MVRTAGSNPAYLCSSQSAGAMGFSVAVARQSLKLLWLGSNPRPPATSFFMTRFPFLCSLDSNSNFSFLVQIV